jgi:hypothetical protein
MKNILFTLIILLIFLQHDIFSQYFGNVESINLQTQQGVGVSAIYFGLENINTNNGYLDIAITQKLESNQGQWNLNLGNGTFGDLNQFTTQGTRDYIGNVFVKLHPTATVKDFVVGRDSGFEIHWNQGGSITEVHQNYNNGSSWTFIESGIFNSADNAEDVLFSNGSTTLCYFINNNDGTLQGPNYVTLAHPVYNFKLSQLDEKAEGYVQNDPNNRSDITFVDSVEREINPIHIYAYSNNANGFSTQLAGFETDFYKVADLETADLDGDGYNDVIAVGPIEGSCPSYIGIRAYRNIQGLFICDSPLWSYTTVKKYPCGPLSRVKVIDLNKDGFNDLVMATGDTSSKITVFVFINQNSTPLFTSYPQDSIDIITEGTGPVVTQIMAADIYGSQQIDGGGIALLVSYYVYVSGGSTIEQQVKVLNAFNQATAPPPPIVQGFLEFDTQNNTWHPHLHLNSRDERDFDHYEIWKFKVGWTAPQHIPGNFTDTGWTDSTECVDVTGEDRPNWNCYYYAKSVDKAYPIPKVSVSSQMAYFTVGCIPICSSCQGGDNPIPNPNQNQNHNQNNKQPEKFSVLNYPNPFNPSTIINFTLPINSNVRITIYNCIGQEILELVNGNYVAGSHSVLFDAKNFSSGIYFYRMEAKNFVETKKMLLLK